MPKCGQGSRNYKRTYQTMVLPFIVFVFFVCLTPASPSSSMVPKEPAAFACSAYTMLCNSRQEACMSPAGLRSSFLTSKLLQIISFKARSGNSLPWHLQAPHIRSPGRHALLVCPALPEGADFSWLRGTSGADLVDEDNR
jgi:hypothetical protein